MAFKIFKLPLVVFVNLIFCNGNYQSLPTHDTLYFQQSKIKKDIRIDTICVKKDTYKFCVVSDYIFNINQERPIYFKQIVILTNGGKLIYAKEHITGYDSLKTVEGRYIKYLNNFITNIGIITTEGQIYFIVDGWGGCNYCSTYNLIVDGKGVVRYKFYNNEKLNKTYSKFGNINDIFKDKKVIQAYLKGRYQIKERTCKNCTQMNFKNSFDDPYND